MQLIYGVVILSSSITIVHKAIKIKAIEDSEFWSTIFNVGPIAFAIRVLAIIFTIILIMAPETGMLAMVANGNTGFLAMDLMFTIFVTFFYYMLYHPTYIGLWHYGLYGDSI